MLELVHLGIPELLSIYISFTPLRPWVSGSMLAFQYWLGGTSSGIWKLRMLSPRLHMHSREVSHLDCGRRLGLVMQCLLFGQTDSAKVKF